MFLALLPLLAPVGERKLPSWSAIEDFVVGPSTFLLVLLLLLLLFVILFELYWCCPSLSHYSSFATVNEDCRRDAWPAAPSFSSRGKGKTRQGTRKQKRNPAKCSNKGISRVPHGTGLRCSLRNALGLEECGGALRRPPLSPPFRSLFFFQNISCVIFILFISFSFVFTSTVSFCGWGIDLGGVFFSLLPHLSLPLAVLRWSQLRHHCRIFFVSVQSHGRLWLLHRTDPSGDGHPPLCSSSCFLLFVAFFFIHFGQNGCCVASAYLPQLAPELFELASLESRSGFLASSFFFLRYHSYLIKAMNSPTGAAETGAQLPAPSDRRVAVSCVPCGCFGKATKDHEKKKMVLDVDPDADVDELRTAVACRLEPRTRGVWPFQETVRAEPQQIHFFKAVEEGNGSSALVPVREGVAQLADAPSTPLYYAVEGEAGNSNNANNNNNYDNNYNKPNPPSVQQTNQYNYYTGQPDQGYGYPASNYTPPPNSQPGYNQGMYGPGYNQGGYNTYPPQGGYNQGGYSPGGYGNAPYGNPNTPPLAGPAAYGAPPNAYGSNPGGTYYSRLPEEQL
eukprot:gene2053-1241_t